MFNFIELVVFQTFIKESKKNFYKHGLKCTIYSAVYIAQDIQ